MDTPKELTRDEIADNLLDEVFRVQQFAADNGTSNYHIMLMLSVIAKILLAMLKTQK